MTREQLKKIIKECLLEILQEGISFNTNNISSVHNETSIAQKPVVHNSVANVSENKKQLQKQIVTQKPIQQKKFNPALDTPISQLNKAAKSPIANNTPNISNNNIFSSILADTAKTTLIEQNSNGHSSMESNNPIGAITNKVQFEGAPENIFGEDVASKWATLAFNIPNKNL